MRMVIFIVLLTLAGCAAPAPNAASVRRAVKPLGGDWYPTITVTARGKGTVSVTREAGRAIVEIHGATIGGAVVTRSGGKWPWAVVLRIHSTGLESIAIAAGELRLAASYSSHGDGGTLVSLWKSNVEGPPLTKGSPYWMEIRAFDAAGKVTTAIPLPAGYFEMRVPAALLEEQPMVLKLQWIDFYR